ncbi:MAG: hypothetical protein D6689_08200 [Deltaproteobacteria bacterium]|nr:MAG: hypothetical protein D6689_08200 [Deltaproteobacteria bacterium]
MACGSSGQDIFESEGIESIVILQRPVSASGGMGDIFQYTSYYPGARLIRLSPPTADGAVEVLCCDETQVGEFADTMDISWYDVSFDATKIVFSAKLSSDQRYALFVLDLASREVTQLTGDQGVDYVYPIFLAGGKIFFMTNDNVQADEGVPQFRDEYERRVTTQVGTMNEDGTEMVLGARNLSHRVYPTALSDGRVLLTQWDHLGEMNAGHLVIMNPDMTVVREAYGKEGTGVANSYLKAVEVAPGRIVTVATSRNRTLQSGALVDVRLGESYPCNDDPAKAQSGLFKDGDVCADRRMAEANAGYQILTPLVPRGEGPSEFTVGRYYDAYPLTRADKPTLLVSWADGPVDDMTLGEAGLTPDFGIYLLDADGKRRPVFNDPTYWDVFAKPLVARTPPKVIEPSGSNGFADDAVLLGSMNVYESTIEHFEPGSVYGVRILEGFSSEEGVPRKFGLTRHEGSAQLGIAPVFPDGSWAAIIPANIPVHQQPIDKFGMALASEPIWISGNPGESRFCGGCHEDRAGTTVIQPGITQAVAAGPIDMNLPRELRRSTDYSIDKIRGAAWGEDDPAAPGGLGALQAIFNAKCVSCHDGTPGPANKSITIMDTETGDMQTITFDLRGHKVDYGVGEAIMSGYSASHLSIAGPDMMELERDNPNLVLMGDMPVYAIPNQARNSILIQKLNPPQLFPTVDTNVRAFDGPIHPVDVGGEELTPDEYYALILAIDSGVQFYTRETAPGAQY